MIFTAFKECLNQLEKRTTRSNTNEKNKENPQVLDDLTRDTLNTLLIEWKTILDNDFENINLIDIINTKCIRNRFPNSNKTSIEKFNCFTSADTTLKRRISCDNPGQMTKITRRRRTCCDTRSAELESVCSDIPILKKKFKKKSSTKQSFESLCESLNIMPCSVVLSMCDVSREMKKLKQAKLLKKKLTNRKTTKNIKTKSTTGSFTKKVKSEKKKQRSYEMKISKKFKVQRYEKNEANEKKIILKFSKITIPNSSDVNSNKNKLTKIVPVQKSQTVTTEKKKSAKKLLEINMFPKCETVTTDKKKSGKKLNKQSGSGKGELIKNTTDKMVSIIYGF